MERLTIEYWDYFIAPDGKFIGKKFENLISTLLPSIGLKLKETKQSWDRSRDFDDKNKKVWAECKIYKENISIRVISPTLVMAIIDKPNKIYFFSYSKLNENAIKHLSQFQHSANLAIYIFDDTLLESLIFNNWNTLKVFFPNFISRNSIDLNLHDIRIGFSKDPEIEYYDNAIEDPRNKELYIYSVFCIDVFIRNFDITRELNGLINIRDGNGNSSFLLLNRDIRDNKQKLNVQVECGGLFFCRLYFKALKSGDLKLPLFEFRNQKQRQLISLNPPNVKVSSIIKIVLIGKRYIKLLQHFKQVIQARHQPVFFNIYGKSGTGKSRMLKEFTEALFEEEFNIIKFDGQDLEPCKFKDFIRKIFSKIYKLPLVPGTETEYVQEEFIHALLYSNDFDHLANLNKILELILSGVSNRKHALIIDNLQNFDESTLIFINDLITKCEGISLKLVLVCCFNTDLLYKDTKNFEVFNRFLFKEKPHDDVFINEEIAGFDEETFELFIDNSIKNLIGERETPFSVLYPETITLFKEKVLNRPLFIEQTLLYLEQENAIERIYERFYIKNIERFHEILNNEFPKNLYGLLSLRWDTFKFRLQQIDRDTYAQTDSAIRFLSYFSGIKYSHAISYGITIDGLNILEQSGFIVIDEKENIFFYHHQLFLFFHKKIGIRTDKEIKRYTNYLERQSLTRTYFDQYFIFLFKLKSLKYIDVEDAISKINTSFQYSDFLIEFVLALFNVLIDNDTNFSIEGNKIISAFIKIGKAVQVFQSMERRQLLFEQAHRYITIRSTFFSNYGAEYYNFIHSFANACITVHKDEEAILLLINSISIQDKAKFANSSEKDTALGKIYNRLCVVYKAVGINDEALKYGYLSQEIAIKLDDKDLMVRNYIDLANVYGRSINNKGNIIGLWENAVSIYHKNYEQLKYQRPMVQLYEAQLRILTGEYDKGIELLRDGVRYCEAHSAHFFEVKHLLLQVISILTFKKDLNLEFEIIIQLIYKAKDLAIRYQINRSYWKILFIEGRIYLLTANEANASSKAAECFIQTIDQFISKLNSSAIEEFNFCVFEYLAYFFKRNLDKRTNQLFLSKAKKLKSIFVKTTVLQILNYTDDKITSYYNSHKVSLLYNDGKFDFPIVG